MWRGGMSLMSQIAPAIATALSAGTNAGRFTTLECDQTFILKSQIYTATATLSNTSPYRSIANSATAFTITMPATPTADSTRVFTNVGAGTLTVSFTGRTGASTRTIAQDNSVTMAFNSTLNYWTIE